MEEQYIRKAFRKILKDSEVSEDLSDLLIKRIFKDEKLKEQAELMIKAYLRPENKNAKLSAVEVPVAALNAFIRLLKEKEIGFFVFKERENYSEGQKIKTLLLSTQMNDAIRLMSEALILSGAIQEGTMYDAVNTIKDNPDNYLLSVSNIDDKLFKRIKSEIKKMPPEYRFAIFKNGKKVSFFERTEPIRVERDGEIVQRGPYIIPKIFSIALACSILSTPSIDLEYEEEEEKNNELRKLIEEEYISKNDITLVRGEIEKPSKFVITVPPETYRLKDLSEDAFLDLMENITDSLNELFIPLNDKEMKNLIENHELDITKISALEKRNIEKKYLEPEKFKEAALKKSLIELYNEKRERILLMSDDFNAKNISNLEDFLNVSISEIILREDNDEMTVMKNFEIERAKNELLEKMKDYDLSYANENIKDRAELEVEFEARAARESGVKEPEYESQSVDEDFDFEI